MEPDVETVETIPFGLTETSGVGTLCANACAPNANDPIAKLRVRIDKNLDETPLL